MKKTILMFLIILTSCVPVGTTTGNSSEVWISNQGLPGISQFEAQAIANEWCEKYQKEAFYRGVREDTYIFGCKRP